MLRVWTQSGMRAGELAGLQWHDVDLTTGVVKVRRTWSRQQLGPTKTGVERDVSVLHPIAVDTHDWCLSEAARFDFKVRSLEPEAFVFQRGGQPPSSMAVHRAWRRVLLAAQVRYRSPEQLRHTFAGTMLSRNAPLLYVR